MNTHLRQANQQWAIRPDDERFLSLEDLKAKVAQRRSEPWTVTPCMKDLRVLPVETGLVVKAYDPTQGEVVPLVPTHGSFGQLSQYAQAPASYLRSLPPELAAINLLKLKKQPKTAATPNNIRLTGMMRTCARYPPQESRCTGPEDVGPGTSPHEIMVHYACK